MEKASYYNKYKVYEHPKDSDEILKLKNTIFTTDMALEIINKTKGESWSRTKFDNRVREIDTTIPIPKIGYPMKLTSKDKQYEELIEGGNIGRPSIIYNFAMIEALLHKDNSFRKIEYDEIVKEQELIDSLVNEEEWTFKVNSIFMDIFLKRGYDDQKSYAPLIEELTDAVKFYHTPEYIKLAEQSKRLIEQNKILKRKYEWAVIQSDEINENYERLNILEELFSKNKNTIDHSTKVEANKIMNRLDNLENKIIEMKNRI